MIFRLRTLVLIAGELGSAALALALAWRMRLTPSEFAELLPTILSNTRVMIITQSIVLLGIVAARADQRSVKALTVGALAGPLLGALWIWHTQGPTGLPRGVAASYAWLYWLLGLAWRSAWILRRASAFSGVSPLPVRDTDGLEPRERSRARARSLRSVLGYRELLRNLVLKDLKLKYRGSVLGFVWSLVNPLIMTAIYSLAFTYVVGITQRAYVMYLLLGLLAWNFFVASASMSTGSIVDSGSFVKGVYFPRLILPLATVLFNLSQYLLTTIVFLPMMLLFYRVAPTTMMLLFPVAIGLQTVFTYGIALALSAGTARFRDVRHFLEIALQVIFWMTPIVYETAGKTVQVRAALLLSPLAPFITVYHQLFYYQIWPDASVWMTCVLYTTAAFLGGAALFTSCEERFAEQF
jgi:lipopolysaccharide transport system permease protein